MHLSYSVLTITKLESFHFSEDLHFLCRLKQGVQGKRFARISWAYWFKKVLYYQVALVYVLTRLVTNVSQVCIVFRNQYSIGVHFIVKNNLSLGISVDTADLFKRQDSLLGIICPIVIVILATCTILFPTCLNLH